jgi:hypothetical protein
MTVEIPDRFKPVAVRDDRLGTTVVSFDPDTKEFFIVVNGKQMGPLMLADIKCLRENLNDIIDLKGRFVYIESYNPDGSQKD